MEYLIHVANVLYLASYLMRDILWLRLLAVVASSCLISYFYSRPEPLMPAIYWNLLFSALNLCWIVYLIMERRPVQLTGDDQRLYQLVFRCLKPREMLRLLSLGRWEHASPNDCFISQGDELDRLMVICSGKVRVEGGKQVEELRDGQFVGGVSFISGGASPANVVAVEETHYMSWPRAKLKEFLEKHSELDTALHLTLGYDLSKRLGATYSQGRT